MLNVHYDFEDIILEAEQLLIGRFASVFNRYSLDIYRSFVTRFKAFQQV